eukprot:TRINITY_DN28301_c0_g1_i1.p1 TRINITY_DN28301_c0_g1~~TRINITY_DN28301_c0_g1_i1.p1  ORF type:complete len:101 (-),score=10.27 TRINITY_DN28301_c0_g1_i1:143-445(-)
MITHYLHYLKNIIIHLDKYLKRNELAASDKTWNEWDRNFIDRHQFKYDNDTCPLGCNETEDVWHALCHCDKSNDDDDETQIYDILGSRWMMQYQRLTKRE